MLEKIHETIYAAQGSLRMSIGVVFPVRMTLIVNDAGEIWLHSPIAIDDALAREIDALGKVRWIVAPNCMHHLYFKKACTRWPEAARVIAPGLRAKRPDIEYHSELGEGFDSKRWPGWIESCFIAGSSKVNETVFLHVPSRSVIVTDLVFNLPKDGHNFISRMMFNMVGVRGRYAQSKLWRWLAQDPKALGQSVQQMLKWDFERVIPAHGAVLEHNAKAQTLIALSWLLK